MRYRALATDYDGTLADEGRVSETTVRALERLRASGRRLVLVTGRELEDLARVFPRLDLFHRVVAENGGILARPEDGVVAPLAPAPPQALVDLLRRRGVDLGVGRAVVATSEGNEVVVLETLRELGLHHQVIRNKGSLMILPAGVGKGTGAIAALTDLGIAPSDVVAVGDAENDEDLLRGCGLAVAVANALPTVKTLADLVTDGAAGAGVVELIDRLLEDDPSGDDGDDDEPRPN